MPTNKNDMTPEDLKEAREQLQLTQDGLAEELERSERFITYRESGKQPIDKMMRYALNWMLLPKRIRDKYWR